MPDEQPPSPEKKGRDNITELAARLRQKIENPPVRAPPPRHWVRPRALPTVPIPPEKIRALTLMDLRKLSPRQELFCQLLVQGEGKSEAMKKAGYKNVTPGAGAAQLLKQLKIRLRIEELTAFAVVNTKVTLDQHMLVLADLRDRARTVGQHASAIKAEELRGKLAGLYREEDAEQRTVITERVAKLPVEEQLRLVQAALQRIQTMTGTRIEMTIGKALAAPQEPFKAIAQIEPMPIIELANHDFDSIEDAAVGLEPRRTTEDEDKAGWK